MKRSLAAALAVLACLLTPPHSTAKQKPPTQWLVLTNVAVVDVSDGSNLKGMTVVIRDDHITAIAKRAIIQLEHNVRVVNASGKFLLAGQWDMRAGTLTGMRNAEVGHSADLILLDAYPLHDSRETQKVWAVVLKGKFLDRRALDKLAEAEAAAKQGQTPKN
jgi:cytosine/adenosine deaminase-related metal-dependent hydrolase